MSAESPVKESVFLDTKSEQYKLTIHDDFNPGMKEYLAWLNKDKKRNSLLISEEARDQFEERFRETHCCKISLTVPEVPVYIGDGEDIYDLVELEKLLAKHDQKAMIPGDQKTTFTRGDIRKAMKFQIGLVDLISDLNKRAAADLKNSDVGGDLRSGKKT